MTLESPLDCKEIQPVHPKRDQPWVFHWKDWCWSWNSNTSAIWYEQLTHLKRPWCWERLRAGEGYDRGWDGWIASPTQWAWVWVDSRSWWWTGRPGILRFMGLQRVRRNWTELNWSQWFAKECLFEIQDCKPLATGQDFSQDYIAIGYCGMEGAIASFMIQRSWNIHQVPSFFFTGRVGVLHGELVGTNSPQARKLF